MKKVLVVGKGISGKSAINFLKKMGYEALAVDDFDLTEKGDIDKFLSGLLCGLLFVVKSPGVSYDSVIIKRALKENLTVIDELELGAHFLKGKTVAVTGTNGKTTTVSLIKFLLDGTGRKVLLGGNTGTPVTSLASGSEDCGINVLECSSFQLENLKEFSPHIAAILNITVDHLSRHKTMENYIKAKQNITKYQTGDDYLLLNADDEILMQNIPQTRAKIFFFSTKNKVVGCYIRGKSIYFNDNLHEIKLAKISDIKIPGEHNLSNILCAVLAVFLLTNDITLFEKLPQFLGVSHRIEFVKVLNEIAVYNDSKATNIASTLVALKSFKQKINLILGGSDKGYDYDELFEKLPKNVKSIVAVGETKGKIAASAKKFGFDNIFQTNSFKNAVILCYKNCKAGEILLLSPASASFDFFKNFEERGNVFKKIIEEISLNENALDKCKKAT